MNDRAFPRSPLGRAISLILGTAVFSPGLVRAAAQETSTLEEVVVTGIRGSLTSSMNVKRDAQGVVDGITAEDIGKFPDTNLAESLQRISGVSIDRVNGEGSRITVRGVGPDFNLVLLNGRQMPASQLEDTSASNSRAFDFANLASESIAGIEVFKTSRASTPTGGIGATINIKTARPLDNPGLRTSFGLKGVSDTSNDNLPSALQGDSVTPEISGIISDTFMDNRFGISLSASYQERDSGFNQAAVGNGWRPFAGDENNWGTIPQPGTPGAANITNRPGPNDTYSVPQNLGYSVNSIQRKRTNGQLVLQYAPVDNVTTTLDYTYSENKVQQQRNDLSVWFNFGPSASSWTNGPVAGPIFYREFYDSFDDPNIPGNDTNMADIAMGGAKFGTKAENKSLGFNVAWDVTDRFGMQLDVHKSTAESGADSPYGSNAVLGTATFDRGTTTADFSQDFPVISIDLPPGQIALDPSRVVTTGSSFRNSYMKSEIQQAQLSGNLDFFEDSRLDFGVSATKVDNRSAYSNVQSDTWGGQGSSPATYPDSIWHADTIRHYFDNISGSNSPNLFNQFFTFDFETVRALAARDRGEALYRASPIFTTDRRVEEKSRSAYLQYSTAWELIRPMHGAVGLRYEKTDVTSQALVPTAVGINWVANNEFSIVFSDPGFTKLEGSYNYVLPSVDFDVDMTDSVKFRASYGESIGRPGWGDIQGGQTLNQLVRINGGTGQQGNPGLKPLLSKNLDFSVEWYYGKSSYASVGYFHKSIDNYVGVTTITDTPFDLPHPGQGALFNEAVSTGGCSNQDLTCVRNYIFDHHAGEPGVVLQGVDTAGNRTGIISGRTGDPAASFAIQVPANQRHATLDGWEFNIQHMFGESGFGVAANYTLVDSDLTYDNQNRGEQFALEGLSDSANVVAFYEKYSWEVRAAYNWRDEFLARRFDGTGLPNPVYTEPYGQVDLNVGYAWDDHLSFQAEVINLTDEIQRLHGRTKDEVLFVTQSGPRYMLGARYKF